MHLSKELPCGNAIKSPTKYKILIYQLLDNVNNHITYAVKVKILKIYNLLFITLINNNKCQVWDYRRILNS